jgi:hypothetical protein
VIALAARIPNASVGITRRREEREYRPPRFAAIARALGC